MEQEETIPSIAHVIQEYLKDYLSLRAQLDGGSAKQLTTLPLFARYDKARAKK